jgi:hypothetical protein
MFELAQQLVQEFLNGYRDALVAYMNSEDRNASGRTVASIKVVNVSPFGGQVVGASHIEFTFRGRGPGKMPPLSNIIDWCNARGLPRAAAWSIARRIAEIGTKLHRQGRNILNEIITEESITKFTDSLAKIYQARIKSDIETLMSA